MRDALFLFSLLVGLVAIPGAVRAGPADHPGAPPGYAPPGPATPPTWGGCSDDLYEPDSMASPQPLSPGRLDSLAVCAGNDDYWGISVEPGQLIRVRIEFTHSMGDVDMTLHRASDGSQIDISDGVTNFEELQYTGTVSESLVLRVYGYDGAANRYALTLTVDDFGPTCPGDPLEPNDRVAEAATPAVQGVGRICLSDEDWYALEVAAGEGFDFGVDFDSRLDDLSIGLYDAADPSRPIEVATGANGAAIVAVDEAESAGRYLVRVFAADGGFNRYQYSVARYTPGAGIRGTISGRVEYEDQLRGRDVVIGAPWTRWLPARRVPVELVRAADSCVIARAYTDESGSYQLPFSHRAGGDAFVRVSARLEAPEGYQMRVLQHEETRIVQAAQSPPLSALTREGTDRYRYDFRFAQDSMFGGAFNIVDRCLDAFRFIEDYTDPDGLDLTVVWQRGRPQDCASCFDDGTIYLGGGFEDPDEYDDSVILHEFGHFFIHELSHDDSPGGNHNGDRTDPLVAYGEGIATVFSMMVEDSNIYVDTMTVGGLLQDFEAAPFEEVRGTSNGTMTGLISEYLVVALIWDLLDDRVESHDHIDVGPEGVMRILLAYMPTAAGNDQGIAGADLADFVEGARRLFPDRRADLDRLLAFYRFPGGNLAVTRPSPVK